MKPSDVARALVLLGITGALLLSADPRDASWGLSMTAQFLPVVSCLLATPLFFFGRRTRRPPASFGVLFFLATWSLAGAAHSVSQGVPAIETFLGFGVCAFSLLPLFWAFVSNPERMDDAVSRILVTGAVLMALMSILWSSGFRFVQTRNIFHEEVFIMGAGAVMAHSRGRTLAAGLALVGCLFTVKITGFMMAAIAGYMIAARWWVRRSTEVGSGLLVRRLLLVYGVAATATLALSVSALNSELLPHGNVPTRLYTYGVRTGEFLASPVWGSAFVGTRRIFVEAIMADISSHSDLLDFLSFGGVLGTLMLCLPIVSALRRARMDQATEDYSTLLVMFVLVMMVNPVLLQPKLTLFFWLPMARLLGSDVVTARTHANLQQY